jgi:DNA-binding NarL/FixJ family response regulator
MKKLRIFLADDHAIVREGLKLLINSQADMEVVGEAGDGDEAWHKARELNPDIVIMDISMPQMNGAQATERLTVACPGIKVIALSAHSDDAHVRQLLEAGAVGYVLKRTISEELTTALRAVANGGTYLDPAIAGAVVGGYVDHAFNLKGGESLSPREREVLIDVARGYTNKEIGERLFVSVKTIEGHKARIMEKLNFQSRSDIVRYAMRQGLLNDHE